MYWQRAVYFPLADHLVQELNDRLLLQENRFLGQYLVPAKLNAFNSGLQVDKLYETYKTDLSEKRDFDNEILRWQTKWSHSTDKNPVTLTGTVSSTLIRTFIPTCSQLLLSSWQCQCQLLSPNDLLPRCAEWRRTYVPRWKQSDSQRLPWWMLTEAYIPIDVEAVIREFCAKKNRRLAFEFLWAPPRFQICLQLVCRASQVVTLLLLLITTTTGCILLNIPLFLVQLGI